MRRALLLLLLVAPPGCHARAGDPCREANEDCLDDHTKLVCKNDRFAPLTCDGPKGCVLDKAMGKARCDWSGNRIGNPCDDRFLGLRMCRDPKSILACRGGKFSMLRCRGPEGCKPAGPEADAIAKTCDTSLAKVSDSCDPVYSSAPACEADDGKGELRCDKGGEFVLARPCRGPKGCTVQDGKVSCDDSVLELGDKCVDSRPTCSADGKSRLSCNGGFVNRDSCLGPTGCARGGGGILCDTGASYEGASCLKKGQLACSHGYDPGDPAQLLECDGATFQAGKPCPGGCTFRPPDTFDCAAKEPKKK